MSGSWLLCENEETKLVLTRTPVKNFIKPSSQTPVLVCFLQVSHSEITPHNIGRFLEEARIMKSFNHPNVLSLIGVCLSAGGGPQLISPMMEFGSLQYYLRSCPKVSKMTFLHVAWSKHHRHTRARMCVWVGGGGWRETETERERERERNRERERERERDRPSGRETDRQIDKQTDK